MRVFSVKNNTVLHRTTASGSARNRIRRRVMNAVLWVVGLIATGVAIWQFVIYSRQTSESEGFEHMIFAIVAALVACGCAFGWFFRKSRDEADQDISITKF